MRPPLRPSVFFAHPLDAILGAPSHVRILRVLSLDPDPVSRAVIADKTGLGASGIGRALTKLMAARAVEPVGDRRRPHYRLVADNRLMRRVQRTFEREAERSEKFLGVVREAAQDLHTTIAVWLVSSIGRPGATVRSDVDIATVWPGGSNSGLKPFTQVVEAAAEEAGVVASMLRLSLEEVEQYARSGDRWWRNLERDALPLRGPEPKQLGVKARKERR